MTSSSVGYVSGTIFRIDNTGPYLYISPTSTSQEGSYVVTITGSLPSPYNSVTATMVQNFGILHCTVTGISSSSITDSSGTISFTDPLIPNPLTSLWSYQFKANNNCGYTPDSWTYTMTSNNDAFMSHFDDFSSTTGLYTV